MIKTILLIICLCIGKVIVDKVTRRMIIQMPTYILVVLLTGGVIFGTISSLFVPKKDKTVKQTTVEEMKENEEPYSSDNNVEDEEVGSMGDYYVFPDSDKRYLTEEDVHEMDVSYVRLGLNEIYARHGRKFNDTELQKYFSSQAWYTPEYTPDEFSAIEGSVFNEYEKANVEFLADLIK